MRVILSLASPKLPRGISLSLLRRVVRESCGGAHPKLFQHAKRGVKVEVALVSDAAIAKLNQTYRGKAEPTDVLSFGNFPSRASVTKSRLQTIDLGTLVVSLPFVRRSAREDGVSWERELVYVFSHGVLHLLGFDHEPEMFRIQDEITDRLTLPMKQK